MRGRESAVALGHMMGTAVALIAPIAIGYWASKRLTAKREGYEPVRWPIVTGFVVSLLILAGQFATPRSANSPQSIPAATDEKHVVEVIDSGASDPFPAKVPPENLEAMRQSLDDMIAKNYGLHVGSVTSKISAENLGAGTVIHYDAVVSNGRRVSQYVGVQAGMRRVVSCVSEDGVEFPACRERAVHLFGQPTADATKSSQNG